MAAEVPAFKKTAPAARGLPWPATKESDRYLIRCKDGKAVEEWPLSTGAQLARQLGLLRPTASTPRTALSLAMPRNDLDRFRQSAAAEHHVRVAGGRAGIGGIERLDQVSLVALDRSEGPRAQAERRSRSQQHAAGVGPGGVRDHRV